MGVHSGHGNSIITVIAVGFIAQDMEILFYGIVVL